jgi:hypothetical protein
LAGREQYPDHLRVPENERVCRGRSTRVAWSGTGDDDVDDGNV